MRHSDTEWTLTLTHPPVKCVKVLPEIEALLIRP